MLIDFQFLVFTPFGWSSFHRHHGFTDTLVNRPGDLFVGVAEQLAGVSEVGFAGSLWANVAELEGPNAGSQGWIVSGFSCGRCGCPGIVKTNPQRSLVQCSARGRGDQEQAGHLAVASFDLVHQLAQVRAATVGIVQQNPQFFARRFLCLVRPDFQGAAANVRQAHLQNVRRR